MQDVFWEFAQPSPTEKLKEGALEHRSDSKDGFKNQSAKAFLAGSPWKFAQASPTEKLKEGALEQRSVSKNGFSNQSSKAFLAGCLWKFGQASPSRQGPQTETCEEGWLQQPIFQSIFHNFFGNLDNKAQQRSSRKEPWNREV